MFKVLYVGKRILSYFLFYNIFLFLRQRGREKEGMRERECDRESVRECEKERICVREKECMCVKERKREKEITIIY